MKPDECTHEDIERQLLALDSRFGAMEQQFVQLGKRFNWIIGLFLTAVLGFLTTALGFMSYMINAQDSISTAVNQLQHIIEKQQVFERELDGYRERSTRIQQEIVNTQLKLVDRMHEGDEKSRQKYMDALESHRSREHLNER